MKIKKLLIWIIIILFLAGGGIIAWKLTQNKGQKTNSSNQQKDNPPSTPLNKLSDQELEKCLLEDFSRRLDLEKYFVFNLGELRTESQKETNVANCRYASENLINHLTKIAASFQKQLEKKGYLTSPVIRKEGIAFSGSNDWIKSKLDEKISNNKDWYIIFEKYNENNLKIFFSLRTDKDGKTELIWGNFIDLPITNSASIKLCNNKSEALEFLKNNDPTLIS